jgi:hypothetical protein
MGERSLPHLHVRSAGGEWTFPAAADGCWGIRRVSNGALQVIWTCNWCGQKTTPVPHHLLGRAGVNIRELPIVEDYAGLYGRCIVRGCSSYEVEWHHIAPVAIFGDDADRWGLMALCREHHQEWGERVTPWLNRPRRGAA